MSSFRGLATSLAACAVLAGCASAQYPINAPLDPAASGGYRFTAVHDDDNSQSLFIGLSFSGGGMRAAALGFGVLEGLRDERIVWEGREKRMLDEVDVLYAVSGGSMVASYYALNHDRAFERFEADFLSQDFQSALIGRVLSPANWARLASPRFGRGDLLQELLDDRLFKGATYGTLMAAHRPPFLIVSASDMTAGERFEFDQDSFDRLCSDLASVPLARAVAASSAVPIVMAPITLWSYADHCLATLPDNVVPESRSFVHLLDGGLADNVSARGAIDYITGNGGLFKGVRATGFRGVRHAVFIVVNAESAVRSPADDSANVPGVLRTSLALADVPINRFSQESLKQLREQVVRWEREVRAAPAAVRGDLFAADVRFHFLEVSLQGAADPVLRERLLAIPTTLGLPADDVAALRAYAKQALRDSPDYRRLLDALRR